MINSDRNLLVLFNTGLLDEKAIELEMECLNQILFIAASAEQFYTACELINRNRITSSKKKMLKEAKRFQLRPFRFFIGKN